MNCEFPLGIRHVIFFINCVRAVNALQLQCNCLGTIHLRRRHDIEGEGGSPLPMFADARGVGVLGLPTSAIFEGIRI